jgi:peptidyl-prolyl cis-trans isomerase D
VGAIEPARQETLDEVKAVVEKAWHDDQLAQKLSAKAADIVKKLQGGEKLETIAAAEGNLEVKHQATVKRSGAEGLSQYAVVQVFNVPVDGAASAPADDGSRILFKVLDAKVPPIDEKSPEFAKLTQQVKGTLDNDIIGQYLEELQAQMGVSVNQRALRSVMGSSNETQ